MDDKTQRIEWLANADLCRRMAERSHDPVLRTRWLTLAQQWTELSESAPEVQSDTEGFATAVHHDENGHRGLASAHQ